MKESYWQRDIVLGLSPLLSGMGLLAALVFAPQAIRGNADFRQLYAGGYMLRSGLRHELYDLEVQHGIENAEVSFSPQVLPVNHPAYEYLFFVPFTLVAYKKAYIGWMVINLMAIIFCAVRIAKILDPWLAVCLVAAFTPVWATVLQGQDSVWLLVFYLLSVDARTGVQQGLLLGLTAFRFHLLIPILLLYGLWRKWQVISGALYSMIPLTALSILIVGLNGSLHYLRIAGASTEVRKGAPVNLYGFFQVAVGREHNTIAVFLTLLIAMWCLYRVSRLRPTVATAILLLPVASYYLMLHDLIVLLLPLAIFLRRSRAAIVQLVMPLVGLYPPAAFVCGLPSIFMLDERVRQERNH